MVDEFLQTSGGAAVKLLLGHGVSSKILSKCNGDLRKPIHLGEYLEHYSLCILPMFTSRSRGEDRRNPKIHTAQRETL